MPDSYFVHESSYVDEPVNIGKGTKIWHFAHVMSGAVIGEKCSIGQNVNISSRAVLGNNVKVQNNVSIYDEVILEDDVFCGPSMVFTNVINPRSHVSRKHEYKKNRCQKRRFNWSQRYCSLRCGNRGIRFCRSRFCSHKRYTRFRVGLRNSRGSAGMDVPVRN